VRKFAEYGKLSGRKLEDLQRASGRAATRAVSLPRGDWRDDERLSVAAGVDPEAHKKKDPFDFALWRLNR